MMKKWLQDLFDRQQPATLQEWRTDRSIFHFLSSRLDETGRLTQDGYDLPDETKEEQAFRFAPGMMDAMMGISNSLRSRRTINTLFKHLKKVAATGDSASQHAFYTIAVEQEGVVEIMDSFLQTVADSALPVQPYLLPFAKDLTMRTDHRNTVKFGICLLGLCQDASVLKEIKIIGLHDEFTVYATSAVVHLSRNAEQDLWDLARNVDGWGKIQLVDRLAKPEASAPLKEWLLMEGYKNSIMYEYLAFTCAVHGELHTKLEVAQVERPFFKAASDIIGALLNTYSPCATIDDYPFASQILPDFIRHAQLHATDTEDFNRLHALRDFLEELQHDSEAQKKNGWTQDVISNCVIDIVEILKSRDWTTVVADGLESDDKVAYWNAKQAAKQLGIDLWATFWNRLQRHPLDSAAWEDVTYCAQPQHFEQILAFAFTHLPFDELAAGVQDSLGIGNDYYKFMILETITTWLEAYPGKGEKIILTALRCPVTRNRNVAIAVLEKWPSANWTPDIDREIRHLARIEPNEDTRVSLKRMLRGVEG